MREVAASKATDSMDCAKAKMSAGGFGEDLRTVILGLKLAGA